MFFISDMLGQFFVVINIAQKKFEKQLEDDVMCRAGTSVPVVSKAS